MSSNQPPQNPIQDWLESGGAAPSSVPPEVVRAAEAARDWKAPQDAQSVMTAWDTFEETHIQRRQSAAPIRQLAWKKWFAIAATLLILVSAGWWLSQPLDQNNTQTSVLHETSVAQHQPVDLPDGSLATLNASSELTIHGDWQKTRTVALKGEAFFDVEKGNTFSVETAWGVVAVLGTTFNVYAREDKFVVSCLSGSVSVTQPNGQQVVLSPKEWVVLSDPDDQLHKEPTDISANAWIKGDFYFDNAPLNEVIAVVERQFGVQVDLGVSPGRTFTGYFSQKSLQEALNVISQTLQLRIDQLDAQNYRISE